MTTVERRQEYTKKGTAATDSWMKKPADTFVPRIRQSRRAEHGNGGKTPVVIRNKRSQLRCGACFLLISRKRQPTNDSELAPRPPPARPLVSYRPGKTHTRRSSGHASSNNNNNCMGRGDSSSSSSSMGPLPTSSPRAQAESVAPSMQRRFHRRRLRRRS